MTKSKRKSQLQTAVFKLMDSESSDQRTRKRLQKKITGLTRKVAGKVYDVRQQKYVKPSSLEEELRLSIYRCHIYGDDNEDLYPLDLIEKMSRTTDHFSRDMNQNFEYLNNLIGINDDINNSLNQFAFGRILIQLAFYAALVVEKVPKIVLLQSVDTHGDRYPELYKRFNGNRPFILATVKKDGHALEYASDALKGDKGVVLAAVKKNYFAIMYASKALQNDKNIINLLPKGEIGIVRHRLLDNVL